MRYKNLIQGVDYFIVHVLVEIVCFTILYNYFTQNGVLIFLIALLFDTFAFVTQGFMGELNAHHKTLDIGSIGTLLMLIGLLMITGNSGIINVLGIVIMATGNAFLHEAGAISTTIVSEGKLFHSALFVAGGSFGVITGQTMGNYGVSKFWMLIPLALIEIIVLSSNHRWLKKDVTYPKFDLVDTNNNGIVFICLAALIVTTCRSFIGYAIPISWKKELWQSFLLFGMMGFGKAFGGYLSDKFGAKKVGVLSTLGCIPFLLIGNNFMIISILGVFCFSLTMSITFGMLLSVIKENPGVAFGVTTVGLYIGILPVFIFGKFETILSDIVIVILSLLSAYLLNKCLK